MPTQAIEEYLESIYKLERRGMRVIAARIAEDLGVSAPTVTEMLRRLRDEGYVSAGREIALTPEGRAEAEILIRRHRLSERLLTDVLGLPWSRAHDEACKWEHVISDDVEAGLRRALDNPSTCPHGNPIPGVEPEGGPLERLSEVAVGTVGVLRCIEAEDEEFLRYLESLGLLPGVELEVLSYAPLDGPVELRVADGTVSLGLAAAERLLIFLRTSVGEG